MCVGITVSLLVSMDLFIQQALVSSLSVRGTVRDGWGYKDEYGKVFVLKVLMLAEEHPEVVEKLWCEY